MKIPKQRFPLTRETILVSMTEEQLFELEQLASLADNARLLRNRPAVTKFLFNAHRAMYGCDAQMHAAALTVARHDVARAGHLDVDADVPDDCEILRDDSGTTLYVQAWIRLSMVRVYEQRRQTLGKLKRERAKARKQKGQRTSDGEKEGAPAPPP